MAHRHHNRPTGKNAPGTAPAEKPLTETEKRRVMEKGSAIAASAMLGWMDARYGKIEVTPEAKADLVAIGADLARSPGMVGSFARGLMEAWMYRDIYEMGARFAAQAKPEEDAAPPKCHACGFTVCACDQGYK